MTTQQPLHPQALQQLTRTAGNAQRLGYGLASVFGAVLLLCGYALTWFWPVNAESASHLRAAVIAALWLVSLPLWQGWYAQKGRVVSRVSAKEGRGFARTSVVMAALLGLGFLAIFVTYPPRGWAVLPQNLALIAAPVLLGILSLSVTRHMATTLMILALHFLRDPVSSLSLTTFHLLVTLPVMLAALSLLVTGLREHRQYRRALRPLQRTP